jgi:hypothetical protein
MNLIIIRKCFKEIHLCTILIQGISTIFIDQMPACSVFKTVRSKLTTIFSTVYHLLWQSSRVTRQNLKQP